MNYFDTFLGLIFCIFFWDHYYFIDILVILTNKTNSNPFPRKQAIDKTEKKLANC
ncbi:unnamed protein product [Prunus brigantina]